MSRTILKYERWLADREPARRSGNTRRVCANRGAFAVRPTYDRVHCFSDGMAAAKRGLWGFIDRAGRVVIAPQFDSVGDFSDGFASFAQRLSVTSSDAGYGFINRSGGIVVPATCSMAYPFKFGIAKVATTQINWLLYPVSFIVHSDPRYRAWAYIDTRGNIVEAGPN